MKLSSAIEILTGPMFSGKTEGLIRRISQARSAGKTVQVFFPKIDTRSNNDPGKPKVQSHGGMNLEAMPVDTPEDILLLVKRETSLVAIDEAQFFHSSLANICNSLVDQGKQVIVAGLDRDFRGEPFTTIADLISRVKVTRVRANCTICNMPADYTQRIINGVPAPYDSPLIMIGGSELYEPRCKLHYSVPGRLSEIKEIGENTKDEILEDLPGIVDTTRQLDQWIDRLQAIARTGLGYALNDMSPERVYDRERYEDLIDLAAEMKSYIRDNKTQIIQNLIDGDWRVQPGQTAYVTPKITAFGAVFNNLGELLLIRRKKSNYWDFPGGWCDIGFSAAENVVKEILEETGLITVPVKLIGIYDSERWGFQSQTQLYALVFQCQLKGGSLSAHPVEVGELGYFSENSLPSLLPGVKPSIHHVFAAYRCERKEVYYDFSES